MRIPDDRVVAPNHSLPTESSRAEPRYMIRLVAVTDLGLAYLCVGLHQRLNAADDDL